MTSVGSVEFRLSLDRSRFDRELAALLRLQIQPLNVDAKLNITQIQRDISNLSRTAIAPLNIKSTLDTSAIKRELQSLARNAPNLKVHARLDVSKFQQDLRTIGATRIPPLPVRAVLDANKLRADLRSLTRGNAAFCTSSPGFSTIQS